MADIGTTLGGRYRLIELLGQGGMATIYRARDSQLERDVAVKILRPEYGSDPDFFARFRQEAQSAASLNYPGVVAVYDYGTDPAGPFIVMELVDGEDLGSIIRRSGALPPRQAARLTSQIARAIAAAHASGFVHRDVKPSNVLVTREGLVKVTDFGIARALAEAALTLPGTTLGSVHYFSPEQARGEIATQASDIYSLGIVLYELLTGQRPWEGDSAAAIATARLTGTAKSPSSIRSGIPPVLEAITRKAMATAEEDRFPSATAMADALDRYLADRAAGGATTGAAGAAGVAGGAAGIAGVAAAVALGGAGAAAGATAKPAGSAKVVAGSAKAAARAAHPEATIAGTAQPNPGARVPYAPDAYAGQDEWSRAKPMTAGRRRPDDEYDDAARSDRTSPWVWIAGLLAIGILGISAFLIFRLLNATPAPGPEQVSVPELVSMSYDDARVAAQKVGLKVARAAFEPSDQPDDTVLSQDPLPGTAADPGTTIKLTLALGDQTVAVPDLRGRTESDALNLIASARLTIGSRSEVSDDFIPVGSVVSQDPGPGQVVTQGLSVNYTVSKGPEPTPTPSPTIEPTLSPLPTAAPTPTPTPGPRNVGNYLCQALGVAKTSLENDGFVLGTVTPVGIGTATNDWVVVSQSPSAGTNQPFGSPINLTISDPAALATCPPGP